jgi:putative PIN family toxin of toxin-antitoxin system
VFEPFDKKVIVLDTNIILSLIVFKSDPTIRFVKYLLSNGFIIVFSPLCYQEYNSIIRRVTSQRLGSENEILVLLGLLDNFLFHNPSCIPLEPINVFHFKDDENGLKYYSLREKDPKDLFLLDIVRFSNAGYLATNDKQFLKAICSSVEEPTYFYNTLMAHQSFLMNLFEI